MRRAPRSVREDACDAIRVVSSSSENRIGRETIRLSTEFTTKIVISPRFFGGGIDSFLFGHPGL